MELLISAHSLENGTSSSVCYSLDGSLTLGRGPESPLLLDGAGISRGHFRLHREGEDVLLTDLSSNGTWVNNQRMARGEPYRLAPADAIKVPGFDLRIEWTSIRPAGGTSLPADAAPLHRAADAEPVFAGGPRRFALDLVASLSTVERILIVLALATAVLVVLYVTA
jgi:predicted component of type VI protein secretion system